MSRATETPTVLRLDKLLALVTAGSRKQAKQWLHAGLVTIDGVPERDAGFLVRESNEVQLEGETLHWPREHYVMLHKPAGYECTTASGVHPLVTDLIDAPWALRLHSAGRLDVDTTGLVLLTSDGQWSHALTSPRRECRKTYLVTVRHPLDASLVARFAEGLLLNDDPQPTRPAVLELLGTHQARLHIHEGRYHQVKRMFAACSNRVEALHREAIGSLVLDSALAPGQWRELSADEVENIADA